MKNQYRLLITILITISSGLVLLINSFPVARIEGVNGAVITDEIMINRPQDPVIVQGDELPIFLNTPINELRLYRFRGAGWEAIPFQIDEVDQNGSIVSPGQDDDDNGQALLDDNDQLVFMGRDSGQVASCHDSLNLLGESHDRVMISVNDSLLGEAGQAYLFIDPSLPISSDAYVDWNESTQTITGTYSYNYSAKLGVGHIPFLIDDLFLNGSSDILDRQKASLQVSVDIDIGLGCNDNAYTARCSFTEEGASNFECGLVFNEIKRLFGPSSPGFSSVGPVRAVAPFGLVTVYGSRIDLDAIFRLGALNEYERICPGTLEIRELRNMLDLNNPAGHGVKTYYDSNGSIATIDGISDEVDNTPIIDWYQISGGPAGGLIVALRELIPGSGSAFTWYLDSRTAGGTGDGASYGEAGIQILNSAAEDTLIGVSLTAYVLPPNSKRNVGETYFAYATTPLVAATTAEICTDLYMPLIQAD